MKKLTTMCALLFLSQIAFSQQTTTDKKEINKVVKTFMECLIKKDSSTFNTLFHKDPVVWIGVFKDKTHEDIMKKS
jgi:4-hydroxy-3-methylbut-2-enyl diphosphate reductase IspH